MTNRRACLTCRIASNTDLQEGPALLRLVYKEPNLFSSPHEYFLPQSPQDTASFWSFNTMTSKCSKSRVAN